VPHEVARETEPRAGAADVEHVATISRRYRLTAAVTPAEESAWPLLLAREGVWAVLHPR
jgi:hypothetical protein